MFVPEHDDARARAIRAHEMMHAKLSPQNNLMDQWVARGIASMKAMVTAEELRINYLCGVAGFDMSALGDDSDTADGERLAILKDWAGCVATAISYAETGSLKKFLVGVRRHNKDWAVALQTIAKNAVKHFKKVGPHLKSTSPIKGSELTPYGFVYTERLAEYIDRLMAMPPPEKEPEPAGKDGSPDDSSESDGGVKVLSHTNKDTKPPAKDVEEWHEKLKAITPAEGSNPYVSWTPLRIGKCPLTVTVQGNLGRKKIASNVGKNPRRISRLLTDPQMRVFDRTIKGRGGIVVVDSSGSMQLTKTQLREIVENAPGCTVLAYSDMGDGKENAYIVAEKGKMTDTMPRLGAGNGCDFPALEWAVKNRNRSSELILFVTDGGVCGQNDNFDNMLALQCIKYCIANNIKVVDGHGQAINVLKQAKNGAKVSSKWPGLFKEIWKKSTGDRLTA